jgi:hypothetical protein
VPCVFQVWKKESMEHPTQFRTRRFCIL